MSLKKIAELTGSSVSTVSRVLNNPTYVGNDPERAEKIWKVARELNYIPNSSARDLRKGITTQENLFTVDIFLTRFHSLEEDAFFQELFLYVREELMKNGCLLGEFLNAIDVMEMLDKNSGDIDMIPYKSSRKVKKEKGSNKLAYVQEKENTGLIVLGKCPRELIPVLKKRYVNISGIDRNPTNYEYDEVVCNGATAAEKAIDYLVSLGHTNIAYIGDCTYESRYIGYYQSMMKHKITLNHGNIYPTNQTKEEGFAAMKQIILSSNRPTAVFCANDSTALGVLEAMKKNKKRGYMPSVISIDNINEAQQTSPMLTTIDIPKKEMAHLALTLLLDRKKGLHTENVRMELPSRLIIRESCNYI